MDTVTIPKEEYERLKKLESDKDLKEFREHLDRSIEDAEAGRVIEY